MKYCKGVSAEAVPQCPSLEHLIAFETFPQGPFNDLVTSAYCNNLNYCITALLVLHLD